MKKKPLVHSPFAMRPRWPRAEAGPSAVTAQAGERRAPSSSTEGTSGRLEPRPQGRGASAPDAAVATESARWAERDVQAAGGVPRGYPSAAELFARRPDWRERVQAALRAAVGPTALAGALGLAAAGCANLDGRPRPIEPGAAELQGVNLSNLSPTNPIKPPVVPVDSPAHEALANGGAADCAASECDGTGTKPEPACDGVDSGPAEPSPIHHATRGMRPHVRPVPLGGAPSLIRPPERSETNPY